MIKKIKTIKNIGSFFNFEWDLVNPSSVVDRQGKQKILKNEFNKLNVLFGENGTGKTTFVKLLKSLNDDSINLIQKNWDNQDKPSSFEFETDSNSILFDDVNGLQNNILKNKILIFDRNYIDNFVHSFPTGRATNHNKNTGSLLLYLGNFFEYRTQLNNLSQLKKNLQDKNNQIKTKKMFDFSLLSPVNNYTDVKSIFENITDLEVSDIDNNIKKQEQIVSDTEKDIKNTEQKISKSSEITSAKTPNKIDDIKTLKTDEINNSFNFSISQAAAKAMLGVSGKENFIKEGVKITHEHDLKNCPFCQQSISDGQKYIEPISQYETIFDKTFLDEQQKTKEILQNYKNSIIALLGFYAPINNKQSVVQINKLLGINEDLPEITLSEDNKKILETELNNIDNKYSDITKVVPCNILSVTNIINDLNEKIGLYNKQILAITQKLVTAQKDVSSGELPKYKSVLDQKLFQEKIRLFIYQKYTELKNIFSKDLVIQKNDNTINKIGELFDLLRSKVEGLFKSFVSTYFAKIEENLSIFCPGLELKVVSTNTRYDLRLGSSGEVTCGLEVHYKDQDRLRDLSEGERQSIALSYFLAFLNKETDKSSKIVVFDDPINSFDSGRRKQAAELIHKEATNFKQLFVLTCDSLFRSYCLKVSNKKLGQLRNFYYILKSASSAIHYRPKEYQTIYSSFKQDFININTVNGTDDMVVVYGQKLRYCLEEIKDRHLGYSEDKFEDILNAVENGRITDLISKIDEIRELYSYCNTGGLAHFPKDGQTSWNEIKSQIGKYMKLGL